MNNEERKNIAITVGEDVLHPRRIAGANRRGHRHEPVEHLAHSPKVHPGRRGGDWSCTTRSRKTHSWRTSSKCFLDSRMSSSFPPPATPDRQSRMAGERVALYLMNVLEDGMTFGVARGRACYYTGRSLQNTRHIHVDTLQLQGAVSELATMDESSGLISLFASKLNGKGFVLNAAFDGQIQSDQDRYHEQRYDAGDPAEIHRARRSTF